jgi:hypothetical protein
MDINITDLQDPGVQVTGLGGHAPGLAGHATDQDAQAQAINQVGRAADSDGQVTGLAGYAPDQGGRAAGVAGRGKVSRAGALLSFLPAKTLTAANVASLSGLRAAGGWRRGAIERTVSVCAYGRWMMFVKAFQNTIRVFSHRRCLGVSWGRGVLWRLGALRLARACTRVYVLVLGARGVALRLFAGPVFAVSHPAGWRPVLVPAIAVRREPIKPKPARRAQNLTKLMTGAGGLGKYAEVMRQKQLPLRRGTLQKANPSDIVQTKTWGSPNPRPASLETITMNKPGRRSSTLPRRSNVRRSRRAAVGAARSVRDRGRRGGRFRKTTYSGLNGLQTS